MFGFMKCVAEAIAENGIKGLVEMVPGGAFISAVAGSAWKKYCERKKDTEQRAEIQQLAEATFEQAGARAVEVVREALTEKKLTPPRDEVAALELYLTAIPEAVRQSLKRPADPTGKSVPADFDIKSADDVLKLLPARPPRFRPGADLPGKSGWVLDKLLGIGGFGEVWLIRHPRLPALPGGAVKFCLGESGTDLIREADLINRVMEAGEHPNIVRLRDVHLDGDAPWLLFEYVSGGNLTDWIHRLAGMSPESRLNQVRAALMQLTEAVGFFHALTPPIVHRDLKPSNILLDSGSNALRITDFGIGAVVAKETLRLESHGQSTRGARLLMFLRGSHTPLYASPQQRNGADADPRDDVHALGVIAYQMLTGHLAQGAGPDFADDLRDAGASDDLIDLLGKCVAQKPERRPKDARELRTLLAATASKESSESSKAGASRAAASPPVVTPKAPVSPPVVATPANVWFHLHKDVQTGPLTFEQLQQAATAGKIARETDHVWQQGTAEWVPAH